MEDSKDSFQLKISDFSTMNSRISNNLNSVGHENVKSEDYVPKNEEIEDKDIEVTYVKKELMLQLKTSVSSKGAQVTLPKTKVQLTINTENGESETFRISIPKSPNTVNLTDVKQYLMSKPKKYSISDMGMYEYSVKMPEIDGFEDCDEDDEMAVLPLFGNMIVLKCWLKS